MLKKCQLLFRSFFLAVPLNFSFVSIYIFKEFNRQGLWGVTGVFDLGLTQESNTMIFYVTPSNKDFFKDTLDRYFQKRYDVFVVKRKWDIPHNDGREMDQFDTDAATHIIWEENGKILGGARLLPTHKPYLLGDLFPELLNYQPPRDPNIWEISRFFIDLPQEFDRTTHPAVRRLFFSIFEFGCLVNAKEFIALTEPHIETMMRYINIPWERTSDIFPIPEGGHMVSGKTLVSMDICNLIRKTLPEQYITTWIPLTPTLLKIATKGSNLLPLF